jgi:hypothetical protein
MVEEQRRRSLQQWDTRFNQRFGGVADSTPRVNRLKKGGTIGVYLSIVES